MPEWHLITVLNFHVCWQIQLTLEQKHWLSCAHPFCLSILSRKCHWVISRWFFLSSISFSLRLQEYISYLMSRYCWCRFFVRRCILLVAMNCTSYQLINDNIYHDNAPLKEEPQLLFSQGAVGLEVFDLNRFLFSIQSHHWYTVPKIWSQTYFFFFFFWCIDGKPTSHVKTSLIHLTIIPYEAWTFPEQYYLDGLWGTWSFLSSHLYSLAPL